MVEQPFTLYIGEGISIQGRIDAVFEREDGVWEVVDYKTGRSDPDPLQLAIYCAGDRGDLGETGQIVVAAAANRRRAASAGRRRSGQSPSQLSRCSHEGRTDVRARGQRRVRAAAACWGRARLITVVSGTGAPIVQYSQPSSAKYVWW